MIISRKKFEQELEDARNEAIRQMRYDPDMLQNRIDIREVQRRLRDLECLVEKMHAELHPEQGTPPSSNVTKIDKFEQTVVFCSKDMMQDGE